MAGIGLGLLSGVASKFMESEIADHYNKKAHKRQMEFWSKQNFYNSPVQQKHRLLAAGLNPAQMYSGGAVDNTAGNLSSVPDNIPVGGDSLDLYGKHLQQRLNDAQIRNIDADTESKREGAELTRKDAQLREQQFYTERIRTLREEIARETDETERKRKEIELKYYEDLQKKTLENIDAGTRNFNASSELSSARKAYIDAQREAGLPEAQARQARAAALDHLAKVKAQVYDAQAYRDMQAGLLSGDQSQKILQEVDILKVKFGMTKVEALNLLETLAQNKIETFTQMYSTELRMAGINPDDKSAVSHIMRLAWTFGELARNQYDGKTDLPLEEYNQLRDFMQAVAKLKGE